MAGRYLFGEKDKWSDMGFNSGDSILNYIFAGLFCKNHNIADLMMLLDKAFRDFM